MKKTILYILFLFMSLLSFSQTKEIERKCKPFGVNKVDEKAETYGLDPEHEKFIKHYKKISECVVEISNFTPYMDTTFVSKDTVYSHHILCDKKLNLDTINKYFDPEYQSFEGFGKQIDSFGKQKIDKGNILDSFAGKKVILILILLLFVAIYFKNTQIKSAQ